MEFTLQQIGSAALAAASFIVAVTALRFSYRSNYGWPPIILITRQGCQTERPANVSTLSLSFEVWNRRKYPLVLRASSIEFADFPVDGIGEWTGSGGSAHWSEEQIVIRPSENYELVAQVSTGGKVGRARYALAAYFFDPIANRTVKIEHRSSFLEWKRPGWYRRFLRRPALRKKWIPNSPKV